MFNLDTIKKMLICLQKIFIYFYKIIINLISQFGY